MSSLDTYHRQISAVVPEVARADMARVGNLFCPVRLAATPPALHKHQHNGVIVAVQGDIVYAR